jgi:hypothetical protein
MMFGARISPLLVLATVAAAAPSQWQASEQTLYDNLGNLSPYHSVRSSGLRL